MITAECSICYENKSVVSYCKEEQCYKNYKICYNCIKWMKKKMIAFEPGPGAPELEMGKFKKKDKYELYIKYKCPFCRNPSDKIILNIIKNSIKFKDTIDVIKCIYSNKPYDEEKYMDIWNNYDNKYKVTI